jgi:hypothetical protein
MNSLKQKITYISLGVMAGVLLWWGVSMLRQRNAALSERDVAQGQADSYALIIAQRDAEILDLKAAVRYSTDTVFEAPSPSGPSPSGPSPSGVAVVVEVTRITTSEQFALGRDTIVVQAKGVFYPSRLAQFNSFKMVPESWAHHESVPAPANAIEGTPLASFGLGLCRLPSGAWRPTAGVRSGRIQAFGHYWGKRDWSAGVLYDVYGLRF